MHGAKIILKYSYDSADPLVASTIRAWVAAYLRGRERVPDGCLFPARSMGSAQSKSACEEIIVRALGQQPVLPRVDEYVGNADLRQIVAAGVRRYASATGVLMYVDSNADRLRYLCQKYKPDSFGRVDFESGGFVFLDFEFRPTRFWGFEFHKPHPQVLIQFITADATNIECPACGHDLDFADGCATCRICNYSKA